MRVILKVLRGVLIGIGIVIPGVSGGSMAVSMGIYDQLIDLFTAGKATRKKSKGLLPYAIGIVIGVLIFSYFIEWMFVSFPTQTAFLFVGMILGALPALFAKVKGQRFRVSHAVLLLGTMVLMILLPIASFNAGQSLALRSDATHALLAVLLGMVAAATMVVPGVSGSMILILLGYYEPVLNYVNAFTAALLHLDLAAMWQALIVIGPFAIGVLLGIVLMARVIKAMLRRFPYATYYAIIGLVCASPFAVLYQRSFSHIDFASGVVCAVVLAAGFLIATLLGKGEG